MSALSGARGESSSAIVFRLADPSDNAVHPGDQDGDESGHGAKQEGWRRRVQNDL
jgi:hypothetical protein